MEQQITILETINKWGYLDTYQISLLLKKAPRTTDTLLRILKQKKLIYVNQITRKNIYYLSPLGNRYLGKESKKRKLNLNELQHQDLIVTWLAKQSEIESYQTEWDLRKERATSKYPDLLVTFSDGHKVVVEIERTRKAKDKFEQKLDNLRTYIKADYSVIWIVPTLKMKDFVEKQILSYGWKYESHKVEILRKYL